MWCRRQAGQRATDHGELVAIAFDQGLRGLDRQQADLESIRSRIGTILGAGSIVSSLFGVATLRGSGAWPHQAVAAVIVSILALVVVVVAVVVIFWPYSWDWGFAIPTYLSSYVRPEDGKPATLAEMHEDVATTLGDAQDSNRRRLDRLFVMLEVAVVALGVELFAWTVALLTR